MSTHDRKSKVGGAPGVPLSSRNREIAQLVSYLVLIAISIALFFAASDLPKSRWEPLGAGTFPQIVMATLGILAAIAALGSAATLSRTTSWEASDTGFVGWLRLHRLVIILFVVFFAYLALIKPLGFSLSTLLYLVVAQTLLAPSTWRSWLIVGILAVVFSFGLNWIFAEYFNVFLPRAQLG